MLFFAGTSFIVKLKCMNFDSKVVIVLFLLILLLGGHIIKFIKENNCFHFFQGIDIVNVPQFQDNSCFCFCYQTSKDFTYELFSG